MGHGYFNNQENWNEERYDEMVEFMDSNNITNSGIGYGHWNNNEDFDKEFHNEMVEYMHGSDFTSNAGIRYGHWNNSEELNDEFYEEMVERVENINSDEDFVPSSFRRNGGRAGNGRGFCGRNF